MKEILRDKEEEINRLNHIIEKIIKKADCPIVIDADGINALCRRINIIREAKKEIILTPHPGEMARLCSTTVENIQADRIGHAKAFAEKYECTLVLKGYQTVIAHPDGSVFVNTSGSDALSTGGSGDVLAGVIASLTAQGYSEKEATAIGVYVHGLAAERLSEKYGKSGVIPSDLPWLSQALPPWVFLPFITIFMNSIPLCIKRFTKSHIFSSFICTKKLTIYTISNRQNN